MYLEIFLESLRSKRESAAGVAYLSMRMHPKSCHKFTQWLIEGRSWSIVVTQLRSVSKLHANTLSPDAYRRKRPNRRVHLELCRRNPGILEKVLNQITLSNSPSGKCAPMRVIKQQEQQPKGNKQHFVSWEQQPKKESDSPF